MSAQGATEQELEGGGPKSFTGSRALISCRVDEAVIGVGHRHVTVIIDTKPCGVQMSSPMQESFGSAPLIGVTACLLEPGLPLVCVCEDGLLMAVGMSLV